MERIPGWSAGRGVRPPRIAATPRTGPAPGGAGPVAFVGGSGGLLGGLAAGGRLIRGERQVEHLPDLVRQVEGHLVAHRLWHVVEVAAVAARQDDLLEAGPVGGQHLLLDAADRQDASLQGDLAGHADLGADRTAGEQAHQRGRHGDAGARAVLRHRARRHVQVDSASLDLLVDAQLVSVRADVGEGDAGRLLHDVAELAGQGQARVAAHDAGLDEQHVAAGAGDRQAGGHARDGRALGRLEEEPLPAEVAADVRGVDHQRSLDLASRQLGRDLAEQPAELALEVSDARLARVVANDRPQGVGGQLHLAGPQARLLRPTAEQVVAGDRDLLLLGVAVQPDDLHTVQQWLRDRLDDVGGGDEQHVRQVQLDLEVVVAERVVLRRVEHLEQGRRRVAPPVGADLVDLVQQEHRVHGPGLLDGPDDAAGLGADVGAPVPADLRLVADAAERDAHELAAHGPSHRLAQRGLADARRADQRDDGAGAAAGGLDATVGAQLAHGQVLDDAVLHVLEAGVVGVEHLACPADVEPVLGPLAERQLGDGVEPGPDPAVLGVLLRRPLQPVDLALDRLARLVGQRGLVQLPAVAGDQVLVVVQLAQLLADGGELLAQQELALALLHALGDVPADAVLDLLLREGVAGPGQDLLESLLDVEGLQQLDLAVEVEVGRVDGGVGELAGVLDAPQGVGDLARAARLQDVLDHCAVLASELARPWRGLRLVDPLDLDPGGAAGAGHARGDLGAVQAPDHDRHLSAGKLPGVLDLGHGADAR